MFKKVNAFYNNYQYNEIQHKSAKIDDIFMEKTDEDTEPMRGS